jgi:hypothetical protein
VLRIHDLLVGIRIRIRRSMPLTNPNPDPDPAIVVIDLHANKNKFFKISFSVYYLKRIYLLNPVVEVTVNSKEESS